MQCGGLVVCLLSVHTRLGTLSLFEIIVYALSVKLEGRVGSVSYCLMLEVDGDTFHSSACKAGY